MVWRGHESSLATGDGAGSAPSAAPPSRRRLQDDIESKSARLWGWPALLAPPARLRPSCQRSTRLPADLSGFCHPPTRQELLYKVANMDGEDWFWPHGEAGALDSVAGAHLARGADEEGLCPPIMGLHPSGDTPRAPTSATEQHTGLLPENLSTFQVRAPTPPLSLASVYICAMGRSLAALAPAGRAAGGGAT